MKPEFIYKILNVAATDPRDVILAKARERALLYEKQLVKMPKERYTRYERLYNRHQAILEFIASKRKSSQMQFL